MRRTSLLGFLCVLVCAACGDDDAAGPDAGLDAYVTPPPSEDWTRDIQHMSLEVDVSTLDATAVITLAPSTTSTGASLEVGDLEIHSVSDARGELDYHRDGAQLDVGVPATEEPAEITIEYTYRYHTGFQGASVSGYTLTWPYYCGNLFPCKSDPSDGLTFDLQLTGVPEGNISVNPSSIPSEAPSYMLAWAIGDYTRIDLGTTTAGTQVAVWHFPGRAEQANAGTEYLVDAVDWLEQTLGEYAFGDTTGAVEVGWGAGMYGGMEHHPFWHVGMSALTSDETHVHEAVHGWFGNGVRIRCWEDFVLSEGPSDYFAARALSEVATPMIGNQAWSDLETRLNALQQSSDNKIAWPDSCGEVDILADGLFGEAPYVKGALFLRAVERRVGVENLDAALRAFLDEYMGEAAGMQDLLDTIEAETGYDPTECANAWLRSEDAPTDFTCPAS